MNNIKVIIIWVVINMIKVIINLLDAPFEGLSYICFPVLDFRATFLRVISGLTTFSRSVLVAVAAFHSRWLRRQQQQRHRRQRLLFLPS